MLRVDDDVGRSSKSLPLSLHVDGEVSERMIMLNLVEEMISAVMRRTGG